MDGGSSAEGVSNIIWIRCVIYDGLRDIIYDMGSSLELSVQRCQTTGWDGVSNCGQWTASCRFAAATAVITRLDIDTIVI